MWSVSIVIFSQLMFSIYLETPHKYGQSLIMRHQNPNMINGYISDTTESPNMIYGYISDTTEIPNMIDGYISDTIEIPNMIDGYISDNT